eukprot:scaffold5688_cov116-Isochrysis_galbana.AAC.3
MAEPPDIVQDGVDELLLLCSWVGIVEPHHRLSLHPSLARQPRLPKVEVHRLGVPNVQITVGLRREARADAASRAAQVSGVLLCRVERIVMGCVHVWPERLGLLVLRRGLEDELLLASRDRGLGVRTHPIGRTLSRHLRELLLSGRLLLLLRLGHGGGRGG